MAVERVTESPDGTRTIERNDGVPTGQTTYVERRGGGSGVIIALAAIVLVAIAAFFLLNMNRSNAAKNSAVTSAAHSVAGAADKVGGAAEKAADNVTGG
jgi:hypothetical protein